MTMMDQTQDLSWEHISQTGAIPVSLAARLVDTAPIKLRSWVDGYGHSNAQPIIQRQLPKIDGKTVLGFLDLIDARFVRHFSAWFSPQTIRRVAEKLRHKHDVQHPFAMKARFRTDGKAIFMEEAEGEEERRIVNLMNDNFEMGEVIAQSLFTEVIYANDIARAWRPYREAPSVIVDPAVARGRPVVEGAWIPTRTLYDAFVVEGGIHEAAEEFDVPLNLVKDAVSFETELERRKLH